MSAKPAVESQRVARLALVVDAGKRLVGDVDEASGELARER